MAETWKRSKTPDTSASGITGNSISDRIMDQMRMAGRPRTTTETVTTEQPESDIDWGSVGMILTLLLGNKAGAGAAAGQQVSPDMSAYYPGGSLYDSPWGQGAAADATLNAPMIGNIAPPPAINTGLVGTGNLPTPLGNGNWLGTTPVPKSNSVNPILAMLMPDLFKGQMQAAAPQKTIDQMTPMELLEALLGGIKQ